mmetsp:Transcript_36905/g.94400  ORF Transcript_36905/g.94400 Transcript_36905/m.94400 type:complete len:801 (+) Transcript_36905:270-2672(+)
MMDSARSRQRRAVVRAAGGSGRLLAAQPVQEGLAREEGCAAAARVRRHLQLDAGEQLADGALQVLRLGRRGAAPSSAAADQHTTAHLQVARPPLHLQRVEHPQHGGARLRGGQPADVQRDVPRRQALHLRARLARHVDGAAQRAAVAAALHHLICHGGRQRLELRVAGRKALAAHVLVALQRQVHAARLAAERREREVRRAAGLHRLRARSHALVERVRLLHPADRAIPFDDSGAADAIQRQPPRLHFRDQLAHGAVVVDLGAQRHQSAVHLHRGRQARRHHELLHLDTSEHLLLGHPLPGARLQRCHHERVCLDRGRVPRTLHRLEHLDRLQALAAGPARLDEAVVLLHRRQRAQPDLPLPHREGRLQLPQVAARQDEEAPELPGGLEVVHLHVVHQLQQLAGVSRLGVDLDEGGVSVLGVLQAASSDPLQHSRCALRIPSNCASLEEHVVRDEVRRLQRPVREELLVAHKHLERRVRVGRRAAPRRARPVRRLLRDGAQQRVAGLCGGRQPLAPHAFERGPRLLRLPHRPKRRDDVAVRLLIGLHVRDAPLELRHRQVDARLVAVDLELAQQLVEGEQAGRQRRDHARHQRGLPVGRHRARQALGGLVRAAHGQALRRLKGRRVARRLQQRQPLPQLRPARRARRAQQQLLEHRLAVRHPRRHLPAVARLGRVPHQRHTQLDRGRHPVLLAALRRHRGASARRRLCGGHRGQRTQARRAVGLRSLGRQLQRGLPHAEQHAAGAGVHAHDGGVQHLPLRDEVRRLAAAHPRQLPRRHDADDRLRGTAGPAPRHCDIIGC